MKTTDKAAEAGRRRQFCTFHIGQNLFGVDITDVKEIRTPDRFTTVCHASDEVRGFVNIRGQIHLVIDLRVLLGFDAAETGKFSRIVLFKRHVGESFGILVDTVGDVVETNEAGIENMGERNRENGSGLRGSYDLIVGNFKLEDKILIILDSTLLLKKVEKYNLDIKQPNIS